MKWLTFFVMFCGLFPSQSLRAQPSQLPSLLDNPDEQRLYLQNMVLKPGEKPENKIYNNIFIKTTVSKTNCFVGEPLLVTYLLYAGIPCNARTTKQPVFSGCSLVEMTTDAPGYMEKLNGKLYRVRLIRKVQVAPLQAGELVVPQAAVNTEVNFSTVDNVFKTQSYKAEVSGKTLTVQVKPLPVAKPATFTGIIGKFAVNATVENSQVPAGENDRLRIVVTGSGNIEAVNEPQVAWQKGIEHFEATDSQHIDKIDFPVSGSKTFDISFIATKEGKITIPSIAFSYFNTETQNFETASTLPVNILVTAALPLKKEPTAISPYIGNKKFLWFVPGIALVVITFWLVSAKKQNKLAKMQAGAALQPKEPVRVIEKQMVRERPDFILLLTALSQAEDNRLFFTNACTLLSSALQYALNTNETNEALLAEMFVQQTNNLTMGSKIKSLYSICNQSIYSPIVNETARESLTEELGGIINKLEEPLI